MLVIMVKTGLWILLLGLLIGLAPVGVALLAGAIASASGCELNEGAVHPCIVSGVDIGGALYFFGMMGWLSLATLPVGGLVALAGLVMAIIGGARGAK
jgi:hypothetical protein